MIKILKAYDFKEEIHCFISSRSSPAKAQIAQIYGKSAYPQGEYFFAFKSSD